MNPAEMIAKDLIIIPGPKKRRREKKKRKKEGKIGRPSDVILIRGLVASQENGGPLL